MADLRQKLEQVSMFSPFAEYSAAGKKPLTLCF